MTFFALVEIEYPTVFWVKALTRKVLDERIQKRYANEKGMMPRGVKFTLEDFMSDKKIVEVTLRNVQ